MKVPKSHERGFGEEESQSDMPDSPKEVSEEVSGTNIEDPLTEALEYFRQQPVPVKRTRSMWPFKKSQI